MAPTVATFISGDVLHHAARAGELGYLSELSQPIATIVAAFLGFFCGALLNHWLAVRRSERERSDKAVSMLQAMIGDLAAVGVTLGDIHDYENGEPHTERSHYELAKISVRNFKPELLHELRS